jgi:hypothetical protein
LQRKSTASFASQMRVTQVDLRFGRNAGCHPVAAAEF